MPVVVYSALRLGLLVVIWLVLLACHVSGIVAFAIAVVLALLISYLVFRGPRDKAGRYIAERAVRRTGGPSRISGSIDADDAAEDAMLDAVADGRDVDVMDAPDSDLEDEPARPAPQAVRPAPDASVDAQTTDGPSPATATGTDGSTHSS